MADTLQPRVPLVLVADDEPDLLALVAMLCRGAGWEVVGASDGNEAVELARLSVPDAMVLDLHLPELDGLGVLAAMESEPSLVGVPVLMLSAQDDPDAVIRGLAAGAHDYLGKPFDIEELVTRVEAALRVGTRQRRVPQLT